MIWGTQRNKKQLYANYLQCALFLIFYEGAIIV